MSIVLLETFKICSDETTVTAAVSGAAAHEAVKPEHAGTLLDCFKKR